MNRDDKEQLEYLEKWTRRKQEKKQELDLVKLHLKCAFKHLKMYFRRDGE